MSCIRTSALTIRLDGALERQLAVMQFDDAGTLGAAWAAGALLDRPLAQLCGKARLLDLIHNFVIFDAGQTELNELPVAAEVWSQS